MDCWKESLVLEAKYKGVSRVYLKELYHEAVAEEDDLNYTDDKDSLYLPTAEVEMFRRYRKRVMKRNVGKSDTKDDQQ